MKVLLLLFAIVASITAESFPTRIRPNIAVCYQDLTDRYQRLPQSLDNLVALIRKVESHQDTKYWDVTMMVSTLLHRFRYDGIIDDVDGDGSSVPITSDRKETEKFKLQWQMLPGDSANFPEESLTQEEKCSLHWMLSYSRNSTMRSEEYVTRLRATAARAAPVEKTAAPTLPARTVPPTTLPVTTKPPATTKLPVPPTLQSVMLKAMKPAAPVPTTPKPVVHIEHKKPETAKDKSDEYSFYSDEDEEDEPAGDDDDDFEFSFFRKRRELDNEPSRRPLEVGVVSTSSGTVAPGIVLAGILGGLERQSVPLKDIIRDPAQIISDSSMELTIDSEWAVTLAGEIGQTALQSLSHGGNPIGPRGAWNSTSCPREYSLETTSLSRLSYAELYGGIDGLILSKRIGMLDKDFTKLSALLEMYYSERGIYGDVYRNSKVSEYRACNRLNNFNDPTKVDAAVLREQSLNAALVMYASGIPGSPTISSDNPADTIKTYVDNTVDAINSYLSDPSNVDMDFVQCQNQDEATIINEKTAATYTDLTFVVDQTTDSGEMAKQKEMIATIANVMDIQLGGSRMEVVSSKDGNPFISLDEFTNKAQLACRIHSLDIPFSERRISDVVSRMRSRIYDERKNEKRDKVSGANTRAIIFLVTSWTSNDAEKRRISDELTKLKNDRPDVHVMFTTFANPEEFRSFVVDYDRDIVSLSTDYSSVPSTIANRLAQVGARLIFPACNEKSLSLSAVESSYSYTGFINPQTVQYYRLGSENFFSSGSLSLRFKSEYGIGVFCYSTTNQQPGPGDSCRQATRPDETIEIVLNDPCPPSTTRQNCSSIYIAASSLGLLDDKPCSERNCHTPDQVKFIFTHEGMQCSGVVNLMSKMTLAAALILTDRKSVV